MKKKETIEKEYNKMMDEINESPGVTELLSILNKHNEIMKKSAVYLGLMTPKTYCLMKDSTDE